MIGVGADWQAMEALKLTGVVPVRENEGNATFGVQDNDHDSAGDPLNIGNFDNTKQQYFNLKGTYELQQELVVHRRLRVREVQPRRHRHRRVPVRAADRPDAAPAASSRRTRAQS